MHAVAAEREQRAHQPREVAPEVVPVVESEPTPEPESVPEVVPVVESEPTPEPESVPETVEPESVPEPTPITESSPEDLPRPGTYRVVPLWVVLADEPQRQGQRRQALDAAAAGHDLGYTYMGAA
ncbi:hypothetical protein [Kitasatospora sp. NPDC002040]|uniref:hypothetical protein n=1 Tax=Kitasatospora sp. NPDC002040 TaxID=3154661 RepID=UPI003333E88E